MKNKYSKIKVLIGSEEACMKEYMQNGPEGLAAFLGVDKAGELFGEIMRYFAFEKDMIFKCAIQNIETLQQIMASIGPMELRKLMGIKDAVFDGVAFEPAFDIIGLGCRSFYKYVVAHKEDLSKMLMENGSEAVREYLCIVGEKYDNLWTAVMDLILAEFSKRKMAERTQTHQRKLKGDLEERGLL